MLLPKLASVLIAVLLVGCATKPQPLYQWGSFTSFTYDSLRATGKSPSEQIDLMLVHAQQVGQAGLKLPPGFHAHLAMLYLQVGRAESARGHFEAERREFPESAHYIDSLMRRANQPNGATSN
jgi:hypothetical protein